MQVERLLEFIMYLTFLRKNVDLAKKKKNNNNVEFVNNGRLAYVKYKKKTQ